MRFLRTISTLAAATAALAVDAPAASAADTMPVSAGPLNRGIVAVDAVSCVQTDAAGDFGTLEVDASILVAPTAATGDYTVLVREKGTQQLLASHAVTPGGDAAVSYTSSGDGTERQPGVELVVTRFNAKLATTQQIDRVVTNGQCGWIDYDAIPLPRAVAIGHGAAGTSAVVHNPSKVALVTDVNFATTEGTRTVNHFKRVNVPAGGTALVQSAALPCGVPLRVETAVEARTYWGTPLSTGPTPACGVTLPTEPLYVAPITAEDDNPCGHPALRALPDAGKVVYNYTYSGCIGSRINFTNYGFQHSIMVLRPGWSFSDYGSTSTMVRIKVTDGDDTFVYRAENGVVRISKL